MLLSDLNFQVQRGEVFVILGGSGSGKSTLLKHMIGLYPPMRGHIWLEGIDIVDRAGRGAACGVCAGSASRIRAARCSAR